MALLDGLVLVALLGFAGLVVCEKRLNERFSWKVVDFEFPNEQARSEAISSGRFIPENNLPLGVEAWKNKLFITLPQWKAGTAATLAYIDLDATTEKSPKLKPYPNWEAHKLKENNGVAKIASVFRLNVDVCDRLWLLDTGVINLLGKAEVLYGPKIQAYNLTTDQLLFEYTIPKDVIKETSFLANIIVDMKDTNCQNAHAYIPDLGSNALIVYNLATNSAWRVTHHYFHFDPTQGDFNIGGVNFQWTDGIFGVSLSNLGEDGYRTLYFHPMASTTEFAVSTKILQNETIASNSYHQYKELGMRGPSGQSSASSIDGKTGVMFYTLLNKNAVGCWNTNNKEYSMNTNAVVASDNVTMSFPNDLKVDKNGVLWVLTDRLPNFWFGQLDFNDVNFRIFSAPVPQAIKGTVCEENSSSRLAAISMLVVFLAVFLNLTN